MVRIRGLVLTILLVCFQAVHFVIANLYFIIITIAKFASFTFEWRFSKIWWSYCKFSIHGTEAATRIVALTKILFGLCFTKHISI